MKNEHIRNEMVFQQPLNPLLERVYQNQLQYREIILNDDVTEDIIELVTVQIMNFNREDDEAEETLKEYDRKKNPITLFVNSSGGLVDDGLSVVSAIRASKTPVHTVVLGKAYSMGFLILIAGHRRFAQAYSAIMYHQISSGTIGTVMDISEYAEHLCTRQQQIEEFVSEHTLLPKEVLEDIFVRKHDLYLTAAEALEWGVIDEIL
jgi:ATP-dependent Clp protease protease subunit